MDITIKELADELGVSKPTISKAIDTLGIQTELRKVGNRFMLSETQVTAVKSQITQNFETETLQKPQEETQSGSSTPQTNMEKSLISLLETQITLLQEQLTAKDAQIANLGKSLSDTTAALTAAQDALRDTTAALTAAQALHAGTMQQQLSMSEEDTVSPFEEETKQKPQKVNRGLFSKVFYKHKRGG